MSSLSESLLEAFALLAAGGVLLGAVAVLLVLVAIWDGVAVCAVAETAASTRVSRILHTIVFFVIGDCSLHGLLGLIPKVMRKLMPARRKAIPDFVE